MKPCYLTISSWIGLTILAEHYYGTLKFENGDKRQYVDLELVLTQRQATRLNRKSGYELLFEKGDKSRCFDTQDDIIQLALKTYREHFPEADVLVLGDPVYHEPQPILDGADDVRDRVNEIHSRCEELGWWDGSNSREVEKLCDEWQEIFYDRIDS